MTTQQPGQLQGKELREEARKRQTVFTRQRDVVVLKIFAQGTIPGVDFQRRDPDQLSETRKAEAAKRGLNPHAYRGETDRADNGFQIINKTQGIRTSGLVDGLGQLGIFPKSCYAYIDKKKGPVTVLVFERDAQNVIQIPAAVEALLRTARWNDATVWANLRPAQGGGGYVRLDTINLAKGRQTDEASRELVIVGGTYRLPPAPLAAAAAQ